MTLLGALLAVAMLTGDGQAAFQEGRFEDAARLLTAELAQSPSYDGYLTLGLAHGRRQALAEARTAFDEALRLDPARPEAWLERGGLSFLEKDYRAAVSDLQQALARAPGDAYARDLLATSLHLAGRGDEALGEWNRLGQPRLGTITLEGLVHTRERLVRRELAVREGEPLRLADLRLTRLRLAELGCFERFNVRAVPRGQGVADLQAAFVERHGFFASPVDFAVSTGILALQGRVRLRYANLSGVGLTLGGEYRFQENRHELSFSGELPRPFGLPASLRLRGVRGHQGYDDHGEFTRRARGFELGFRHVRTSRVLLEAGLQARERTFTVARSDAPPGWMVGPALAVELRLVEGFRQRLDARAALARSDRRFGAEVEQLRTELRLVYKLHLLPPEGAPVEPSLLAVQLKAGRLSDGAPIDEWLAPGGSPDMEWPLRARRLYRDGRLGSSTPLGRTLAVANLEWRRRLYKGPVVQLGSVLFYDAGWVARGSARAESFHDVGVGLRIGLRAGPLLRLDYGHGLTDGRGALQIGLGYFF